MKVLPYMGAALTALAMAWSAPSQAQDILKDVPAEHWAYDAVKGLAERKILIGYPDGFFKGRRYMTRYEFATALWRYVKWNDENAKGNGAQGPKGDTGETGPAGPQGPAGVSPEELATLRRLIDEFRPELAAIGANLRAINARLDDLTKRVGSIEDTLRRMPKWSGSFFTGVRGDQTRFPFVDQGGARRNASRVFTSTNVVHDLHLKIGADLGSGNKFTGDLVASNYLSYRGNTLSGNSVALNSAANSAAVAEVITPYQAQVDIPFTGLGQDSKLTVGRYKMHLTPLTYMRPDLDPYFNISEYDDGNYVQDGVRLTTRFGGLKATVFGASFASVADNNGFSFNRPLVGGGFIGNGGNGFTGKPFGINAIGNQNVASQTAGVNLDTGLGFAGIGLTVATFNTAAPTPGLPNPFSTVNLYAANLHLNNTGKLKVSAEAAKTTTGRNFTDGDGLGNEDNSAYALHVGYDSGALGVRAGYNYIDPRYGAPGSWMQIGNWYNPTNVRGPYVRLGYKLNDMIGLHISGNFLEGARNRTGYLSIGDRINNYKAGLSLKLSDRLSLMADYEGVRYELSAGTSASGVKASPLEQYLTFGAGWKINNGATLKLGYQLVNWDNKGNGFGGGTGITGVGGGGTTSNASVFTTSLAVRF